MDRLSKLEMFKKKPNIDNYKKIVIVEQEVAPQPAELVEHSTMPNIVEDSNTRAVEIEILKPDNISDEIQNKIINLKGRIKNKKLIADQIHAIDSIIIFPKPNLEKIDVVDGADEEKEKEKPIDIQEEQNDDEEIEFEIVEKIPKKVTKEKTTKGPRAKKDAALTGVSRVPTNQLIQIGDTPLNQRLPHPKEMKMSIPSYYMNNRKMFIQFINGVFDGYKNDLLDESQNITCENMKSGESFSLLTHQKIVRDYMNLYTPYRGLLLYHGLGSGKTCSSIATAEGMKSSKKVIIMTPASLRPNYISELKKCGDLYYKKQQYWEWVSIENRPDLLQTLSSLLNLPMEFIIKNRGAWLIDITKPGNYETLSKFGDRNEVIDQNQFILNAQIDEMIKQKYEFINHNGIRSDKYNNMRKDGNIFNNKVVIIDEAHNLISRIVNQLNKQKDTNSRAKTTSRQTANEPLPIRIYKDLMSATNCKIVLLTGTPVINYPNEISILFNILRGTIEMYELKLVTPAGLDLNGIKRIFKDDANLDYIDYKSGPNLLSITRNPFGFNSFYEQPSSNYKGVKYQPTQMNEMEFISYITQKLSSNGITLAIVDTKTKRTYEKKSFTALPDKLTDFKNAFINSQENNEYVFKNHLQFKYRIMGLTSYFRSAQEELLPRYSKSENFHVINIPMSQYQFGVYEKERIEERKKEKKPMKPSVDPNGIFIDPSSTFKIFSRLACNFVEPSEKKRPKPPKKKKDLPMICKDNMDDLNEEEEIDIEAVCQFEVPQVNEQDEEALQNTDFREFAELEADEVNEKIGGLQYKQDVAEYIGYIKNHADEILSKPGLEKHSPKFLAILNNIQNPEHLGLHLLYSQLRSIEGIELFTHTLNQNGFSRFKIKLENQRWVLDMDKALLGTPTYALYTGTENSVEREILRSIYNGSWKDVPKSLSDILIPISETNNMGQLIKVLMITSAGSEGINLLNTRYVHIMEPYWHPVRTEQVIGRARRICSHQSLPLELQTVDVFMYLMTLTKEQTDSDLAVALRKNDVSKKMYYIGDPSDVDRTNKSKFKHQYFTSDQTLFEISNIKEELGAQLLKAVKESSIDCATHVKSSVKENLTCISFGNLSGDNKEFAYKPDISTDPNDNALALNQRTVELGTFNEIKFSGKTYAYQTTTGNIYTTDSYEIAATTNNSQNLVLVGRVINGKVVLNR